MIKLEFNKYVLDLEPSVYLPSDDTYLLLDVLKQEIGLSSINNAIEIGSGSGVISLFLYDYASKIYAIDINKDVINSLNKLKEKYKLYNLEIINSDLFTKVPKDLEFDLIVFNPPYVPTNKEITGKEIAIEDLSTIGGIKGREIIVRFLGQLQGFLSEKGVCFLLISSHNEPEFIYNLIKQLNLDYVICKSERLFFEQLIVIKIFKK
ncbi:MAG: HemK2/MTQ2 family protein methyltransferase [archaeon]